MKPTRAVRSIRHESNMAGVVLPPQSDLLTKAPADSAVVVFYPFASDPSLKDRYLNCWGAFDKGILLEDLDALAGNVGAARYTIFKFSPRFPSLEPFPQATDFSLFLRCRGAMRSLAMGKSAALRCSSRRLSTKCGCVPRSAPTTISP